MRNAPISLSISPHKRSLLIHASIFLPQPLFIFPLSQSISLFVRLSPYLYLFLPIHQLISLDVFILSLAIHSCS